jgi:hypothetical protein
MGARIKRVERKAENDRRNHSILCAVFYGMSTGKM